MAFRHGNILKQHPSELAGVCKAGLHLEQRLGRWQAKGNWANCLWPPGGLYDLIRQCPGAGCNGHFYTSTSTCTNTLFFAMLLVFLQSTHHLQPPS